MYAPLLIVALLYFSSSVTAVPADALVAEADPTPDVDPAPSTDPAPGSAPAPAAKLTADVVRTTLTTAPKDKCIKYITRTLCKEFTPITREELNAISKQLEASPEIFQFTRAKDNNQVFDMRGIFDSGFYVFATGSGCMWEPFNKNRALKRGPILPKLRMGVQSYKIAKSMSLQQPCTMLEVRVGDGQPGPLLADKPMDFAYAPPAPLDAELILEMLWNANMRKTMPKLNMADLSNLVVQTLKKPPMNTCIRNGPSTYCETTLSISQEDEPILQKYVALLDPSINHWIRAKDPKSDQLYDVRDATGPTSVVLYSQGEGCKWENFADDPALKAGLTAEALAQKPKGYQDAKAKAAEKPCTYIDFIVEGGKPEPVKPDAKVDVAHLAPAAMPGTLQYILRQRGKQ